MPHRLPLSEMVSKIKARELSPVELIDAHLKQIEAHNPRINAFVVLLAEQARQAARQAEAAIARGDFPFSTGQVFDLDGGFHLRRL